MNIYIDDEEVLCASNMIIKEQIKNTSSVILNNVYPKTWENDKDYTTRFYMPKDYSHCAIKNDKTTTTEYDLSNNISYIDGRFLGNAGVMHSYANSTTNYVKVEPGRTYKLRVIYYRNATLKLWQNDTLDVGSASTEVVTLQPGYNNLTITPTKKYLIICRKHNGDDFGKIDKITTTTTDNLVFSGIVKNSGNLNLNPRYPHYATLQILDYKALLSEGDTLDYVLTEQTASSAIKEVVRKLKGFYVGTLDINDVTMPTYSCSEKTAFDVLEYLAEITGSIWYTKAICEDIVLINFCSADRLPVADDIDYTQEYFEAKKIEDIQYSYSAKDYRNKQIIVNNTATGEMAQTEYLTYEGQYLQTMYPISSIVSIKIGVDDYTFTTQLAKNNGQSADFYYDYNSNRIEASSAIGTGLVFEITYYPIIVSRQIAYSQDEIDRISNSTGRDGTITRYEKRTDTNNEANLAQIAQTYLDYKGVPEITLKVKTYYDDLLEVGQRVFFNGPLNDLTTNYLCIEKQTDMTTIGNEQVIFYTYTLSSSFNVENEINFFDNQRRKTEGNIQEGEFISRYIDLASETNIIFFGVEYEEVEVSQDTLDAELDVELEVSNGE